MIKKSSKTVADSPSTDSPWLEVAISKVQALRFGSVQITVHDGRVTQIESLEKTRFVSGKENLRDDSQAGPIASNKATPERELLNMDTLPKRTGTPDADVTQ
ncbi:MAG: YezD family protein [Armatimonadetes bacterium]|nr:YezD family protein [Akkermansiaceae bacterium]